MTEAQSRVPADLPNNALQAMCEDARARAMALGSEMDQKIEAPDARDIDRIARQLILADSIAKEVTGRAFDGSRNDLVLIQQILDSKIVERDATYTLQSLGVAFGKVFVEQHAGYDWWLVEDEYGRDPAIRFGSTSLLAFPQTIISKRVEDGEAIDVLELFDALSKRLAELAEEQSHES